MKRTRERIREAVPIAVFLLSCVAILLCAAALSGCSPRVEYVPVERTVMRTDTVYSAKVRVDSVIFRDSVAMVQKGDTVFLTNWKERLIYRERTDTVYQAKTDSVRVPYPVEKTVYKERDLTAWQKAKMDFGGGAIAVLCIAALAGAFVWFMRIKRRKQ